MTTTPAVVTYFKVLSKYLSVRTDDTISETQAMVVRFLIKNWTRNVPNIKKEC
jgi:hypothetical protein